MQILTFFLNMFNQKFSSQASEFYRKKNSPAIGAPPPQEKNEEESRNAQFFCFNINFEIQFCNFRRDENFASKCSSY